MPVVKIELLEGRSLEQKREMATKITDIVSEVGKTAKENIFVVFDEYPKTNWAVGGTLYSDK